MRAHCRAAPEPAWSSVTKRRDQHRETAAERDWTKALTSLSVITLIGSQLCFLVGILDLAHMRPSIRRGLESQVSGLLVLWGSAATRRDTSLKPPTWRTMADTRHLSVVAGGCLFAYPDVPVLVRVLTGEVQLDFWGAVRLCTTGALFGLGLAHAVVLALRWRRRRLAGGDL